MGVEVVGHWHFFSIVLTRPARTHSASCFPDSCPVAEGSRPIAGKGAAETLFSSSRATLYHYRIGVVKRFGYYDGSTLDNYAPKGGPLDLAQGSFWGDRDQLRANPTGRLAATRLCKQDICPKASMHEEFSSRDIGLNPGDEVFGSTVYFSKTGQSESRPLLEDRPQPNRTADASSSASMCGTSDPPGLGERTFRLMRRRLASATGLPGEFHNPDTVTRASSLCQKKERIKEVAQSIGDHVSGVKIPSSLRDLKRKARARTVVGVEDSVVLPGDLSACSAIKRAFASMVFMIRALQSYTLHTREVLLAEGDSQELMCPVTKEMHTSFVRLFEQVYSCTPRLMVSLMILLSNFTVFSMGSNVASAAVVEEPTPILLHHSVGYCAVADMLPSMDHGSHQVPCSSVQYPYSGPSLRNCAAANLTGSYHSSSAFGSGWGYSGPARAERSHDRTSESGEFRHRATSDQGDLANSAPFGQFVSSTKSEQIHLLAAGEWQIEEENAAKAGVHVATSVVADPVANGEPSLKQLLEETVKELELKTGEPYHHVYLDQETIRRLVAPVTVKVEHDDYACFDRTDLEYQHAISAEPMNPLLLANYAQFLYVVRRQHDSADALFQRAMQADPADGEVIGRYASFLWLARGHCAGADKAYKAAIALDPCNPYFAGSYAHFLWHSEGDSACLINPMTCQVVTAL